MRSLALLAVPLLALGCHERRATTETTAAKPEPTVATPAVRAPLADEPLGCATLRDVTPSDLVRLDDHTIFYVEPQSGFSVIDVSDAERPRPIARVPFVGTPLVLFVRDGIAWTVFVDSDARHGSAGPATVVRAIDVRRADKPAVLGEIVRPGVARDAKLVDGTLYLLRDGEHASVESFGVKQGALTALDTATLEGAAGQLAASPAGLAAVTTQGDETRITWIDLPPTMRGALAARESAVVPGGFASWERRDAHVSSTDEDAEVRVVTCATRACAASEPATLRTVRFGDPAGARIGPTLKLTSAGGLPVTRFVDDILYVAELPRGDADRTTLHVVKLFPGAPRETGRVGLRGTIASLVPRERSVVALGTTGTPETGIRIVVHDVDIQRAPRVRGSVSFGSDWTWTLAGDDEHALSFDPASRLAALPFSAWRRADATYASGTQIVELGRFGATAPLAIPSDGLVERAVFVDGRLVTIGANGVSSYDYATLFNPAREVE